MRRPLDPEFLVYWRKKVKDATKLLKEEMFPNEPETSEKFQKELHLLLIEARRILHGKDFYFFLEDVLEMKGLSTELHGDMAQFLERKHPLKLLLAPRGHLKSTIGTVAYAIWRLMKNPDLRILIANYKLDNAKAYLHEIKSIMQSNEIFQGFYKKFIPSNIKEHRWNESQLTIRRNKAFKEASIEVTGVGGEITGKHYDLIIYDDVVGPDNVATLEQAQKLRTWFNQMQAILEPDGEQVLIGTRWHFADLYGYLIETMAGEIDVFHRGVYKEDGSPVWPEKFPLEVVARIKKRMESDPKTGRAMFVAQYLNQVIDEETASFRRAKMRFFSPGEEPKGMAVSIAVDPAISEKQSADRTAFTVRGLDPQNQWWVLETIMRRGMTPTEIVEMLFELYAKYSVHHSVDAIGVEAQAYQKSLIFSLQDEMRKRNVFFNLVELGNWRTSKELRIKGLIPRYDQGAIIFRKPDTGDDSEILIDELLRFPKSRSDDGIDSLAFHLNLDVIAVEPMEKNEYDDEERDGLDRYGYRVAPRVASAIGTFI